MGRVSPRHPPVLEHEAGVGVLVGYPRVVGPLGPRALRPVPRGLTLRSPDLTASRGDELELVLWVGSPGRGVTRLVTSLPLCVCTGP